MPTEVPHCIDCGSALKAVPTWLATAKVSFTCTACPRRSSRATTRFDTPAETRAALLEDADIDVEEADDIDEEADLELPAEEIEDFKDEADA